MASEDWDPKSEAAFTPAFVQKYLKIRGLPYIYYDDDGTRHVETRYLGKEPALPDISSARVVQVIWVDEVKEEGNHGWARMGVEQVKRWLPSGELDERFSDVQIDQPYAHYTLVDLFVDPEESMPDVTYDIEGCEIRWNLPVVPVLAVEVAVPPTTKLTLAPQEEGTVPAQGSEFPIDNVFTLTPTSLGLTLQEVREVQEERKRANLTLEQAFALYHLRREELVRKESYIRVDDVLLAPSDLREVISDSL